MIVKIILSRKGFDSSVGGHPNPILPNGTMISLPIPTVVDTLRYDEIAAPGGKTIQQVIDELSAGARIKGKGAHLDPDLVPDARPRLPGWRPAFGQIGSSATHLRNQSVGVGDLFLFYGWFKKTEEVGGRLQFMPRSTDAHIIFGYLEIGEIITSTNTTALPVWLRDHPHAKPFRMSRTSNTIYISAPKLKCNSHLPGADRLLFTDQRILTKRGHTRSKWNLDPRLFQNTRISYHSASAWKEDFFQSYPRAQEYVIDASASIISWVERLILGD